MFRNKNNISLQNSVCFTESVKRKPISENLLYRKFIWIFGITQTWQFSNNVNNRILTLENIKTVINSKFYDDRIGKTGQVIFFQVWRLLSFDLWGHPTWKIKYFGRFVCVFHLDTVEFWSELDVRLHRFGTFSSGVFLHPLWCFMYGKNFVPIGVRYRYLGLHSVEFIWSYKLMGIE